MVLLINAESLAALSDPSNWEIGGVALILIPLDSVPHQIATWRHCRDFPGIERFVLSGVPSTDETADFQGRRRAEGHAVFFGLDLDRLCGRFQALQFTMRVRRRQEEAIVAVARIIFQLCKRSHDLLGLKVYEENRPIRRIADDKVAKVPVVAVRFAVTEPERRSHVSNC